MNVEDILRKIGTLTGPGGGEFTESDAADALIALFRQEGLSEAEIRIRVGNALSNRLQLIADWDRERLGAPSPFPGQGLLPEQQETFRDELGELREGRRQQFGTELQSRVGQQYSFMPSPFKNFLGRQFAPMEALWNLQRGLGDLGSVAGGGPLWRNFLTDDARSQAPTGDQLRGLVGRAGRGFRTDPKLLSNQQTAWLRELAGDPGEQYNLALQSVLPDISPGLRNAFSQFAGESYNRRQEANPAENFLDWFTRNAFRFQGA